MWYAFDNWAWCLKVQPDGTGYTVLLNFSGSYGEGPHAGLVLADTKTDTKRVKKGMNWVMIGLGLISSSEISYV